MRNNVGECDGSCGVTWKVLEGKMACGAIWKAPESKVVHEEQC